MPTQTAPAVAAVIFGYFFGAIYEGVMPVGPWACWAMRTEIHAV
jgi:hypothetical protein